jgi:hypothetical protein
MSVDEVDEFLARSSPMVVGRIAEDGWPTGALMSSTYEGGVLSLQVDPEDPTLRDLERDARICCIADEHRSYYEIRGVILHGRPSVGGPGRIDVEIERVISFDFGRLR